MIVSKSKTCGYHRWLEYSEIVSRNISVTILRTSKFFVFARHDVEKEISPREVGQTLTVTMGLPCPCDG